ncbi:hypothetical protein BG55_09010 [Erwinia mallotivora]|uniref:Uncharacterized protein n=1 Tax=Erwinia mallotivora TaxID=69222 RepID=A0A014M1W8_9GAMM|nr:hypothetical protein BG55_09010 [Erwinia mallotivora]
MLQLQLIVVNPFLHHGCQLAVSEFHHRPVTVDGDKAGGWLPAKTKPAWQNHFAQDIGKSYRYLSSSLLQGYTPFAPAGTEIISLHHNDKMPAVGGLHPLSGKHDASAPRHPVGFQQRQTATPAKDIAPLTDN